MTETETAEVEVQRVRSLGSLVGKLGLRAFAERWSLLIAFVGAFAFFSIAKTDIFLTWNNFQAILDDASVLSVLAVGVTVVLVIGEFDLSVGTVIGMTAAASVAAMSYRGAPAAAAILIALGAGALAGLANGIAVAFVRIPSFIATLAIGSIAGGIELAITKSSIFEGLDPRFLEIATIRVGGFSLRTFIAIGLALAFLVILRTTVFGRNASAVGDNPAAARLTGVPVQRVKVIVRNHRPRFRAEHRAVPCATPSRVLARYILDSEAELPFDAALLHRAVLICSDVVEHLVRPSGC